MGRSTSCFKIITCSSESLDDDNDLQSTESPSDKRGWSFRKRSARHRVLNNTVISETPSVNKDSLDSAVTFHTPATSTAPEKISVLQLKDEKPQLSPSVNPKAYETVATEKKTEVDTGLDESVAVVIQAAIRGFLAQRTLLKLKSVVKLQSAVRGHLVRNHAVGTLRCVQAIVKMQTLVRARRARLSLQGSFTEEKIDGKNGIDNSSSNYSEKENSVTKPNLPNPSIEKLLSNGFARQLLESTPKNKPIQIKCDPSKPNSAWKWLERWMSVSPPDIAHSQKLEVGSEHYQQEEVDNIPSEVETAKIPSEVVREFSIIDETPLPLVNEENLITYDSETFDFHANQPRNTVVSNDKATSLEVESPQNQTIASEVNSQVELEKAEVESEQSEATMKNSISSEQLESEGNKIVFGSRKVVNPAFIAAQSKFEEMSSAANSSRSINTSYQDMVGESNVDTKELSLAENIPSECGTELSVTSTLDSPDRSEVGVIEFEHEAKVSVAEAASDAKRKDLPTVPDSTSESVNANVDSQVIQKPERSASDIPVATDSEVMRQTYRSSPEASPRSLVTVPESQGTPSSQVSSVTAKRSRTDKSMSSQKRRSMSTGKRSPSNPNHDSGARNSVEQLPKEQKTGKRRNSFGSMRPENVDQEARDSSSSGISVPSYMQATESARAKVNANNSPRSSPDVLDKEIFVKKRHSLPASNGRQGSPRIERSLSQAAQQGKGNGSHPHNERKWQR